ncbi:MAG: type IX secretion system membrane protein PorP/SprF [Chitinophagales bacterium]
MKQFLTIIGLMAITTGVMAQQDPQHTMYRFNGLMFNPAYAGSREALSMAAIYRWQWVNVPGAPQTGSFSIHSPLKNNNIALGLTFVNDRYTVVHTNKLEGTFAYRIPLGRSKRIKLSFGISAGFTNYRASLAEVGLTEAGDPKFQSNVNLWMPNLGFGVYAYGQKWFVGMAVPNLLQNSLEKNGDVWKRGIADAHQYMSLNASAGYAFDLGKKVKFAPSVFMKWTPKHAPVSFDFNANFIFIDRIWLGASYRLSDSYGFMAAFNITPQWRVGYAYDLTVTALSKFTTGSHEIMMGYDLDFNKKRLVNPRYVRYF